MALGFWHISFQQGPMVESAVKFWSNRQGVAELEMRWGTWACAQVQQGLEQEAGEFKDMKLCKKCLILEKNNKNIT